MRKLIGVSIILILMFSNANAILADDQIRIFLRVDGIEGEATATGFEDWIEILTWGWDIGGDLEAIRSKGLNQPEIKPLFVKKYVDSASPFCFLMY